MNSKVRAMLVLAVLLGGFSLYLNKDWFAKSHIQIYDRSRPARLLFRRKIPQDATVNPIVFGFNEELKLTELKVVTVSELETNQRPHPVWHLISESNSIPVKDFMYGTGIRGMHPAIKGAAPEPLEPGVKYRLLIAAGSLKAEHDFTPTPIIKQ